LAAFLVDFLATVFLAAFLAAFLGAAFLAAFLAFFSTGATTAGVETTAATTGTASTWLSALEADFFPLLATDSFPTDLTGVFLAAFLSDLVTFLLTIFIILIFKFSNLFLSHFLNEFGWLILKILELIFSN
jgi:hypothetical protein